MRFTLRLIRSYLLLLLLLVVLLLGIVIVSMLRLNSTVRMLKVPASYSQAEAVAEFARTHGLATSVPPELIQPTLDAGGWLQVLGRDGHEVSQLHAPASRPHTYTTSDLAALLSEVGQQGDHFYQVATIGPLEDPVGTVLLVAPRAKIRRTTMMITPDMVQGIDRAFAQGVAASLIGVALLLFLLAALYARRMTRPLKQLTLALKAVGHGDFSRTIPVEGKDEFADLATSYNDLIERLGHAETERNRAEQARRNLVANLSHDLRTPLSSLQGFAEALADQPDADPPDRQRYARIIRQRAGELDRLLADLLELSRLQSAPTLQRVPTDLAELVREAIIAEADEIEAASLELQIELAEDLPQISIDAPLLRRAITNLLVNTRRHATDATWVRIRLEQIGPHAVLTVADNGVGIDPTVLPHLFDRYYRGTSRTEASPGTGLGLAIVREILAAHGGDALATSRPSSGSTFTLRLPLTTSDSV